ERHEDLRLRTDRRAREAGGTDADDRERRAVHDDRAPDDGRVASECVLPIVVAEHDDGRFADLRLVRRRDETPDGRLDLEHIEIAARYEQPGPRERLSVVGEIRAE